MSFDATFWVAVSFVIFVGVLFYFKVPQKIFILLDESINKIKKDIEEAEKLKEEAKSKLAESEKKLDNSKNEIKKMISEANETSEKNILRLNETFQKQMDIKKINLETKIQQLKNQAIKDVKNASISIAFESVEKLMTNSLDKSKLDKIYNQSLEETKLALLKKSS